METNQRKETIGRTARNLLDNVLAPRRLIAHELALGLSDAMNVDEPTRQEIVACAMCIGQWLSDEGVPGRWDRIDPESVLEAMGPLSPRDERTFLFNLAGLVGHAGLCGGIPVHDAIRIVERILPLATDRALRSALRNVLRNLAFTLV